MSLDITFKRFVNIPRASLLSQVLGFFELLISVVWSDLCQQRTVVSADLAASINLREYRSGSYFDAINIASLFDTHAPVHNFSDAFY